MIESEKARTKERKGHGGMDLANVLHRLHVYKLSDYFHTLSKRAQNKAQTENVLRKVIMRTLHYRLRYYLKKWRHQQDKVHLAAKLDRTGPAA